MRPAEYWMRRLDLLHFEAADRHALSAALPGHADLVRRFTRASGEEVTM
jgi:hypothetical protein